MKILILAVTILFCNLQQAAAQDRAVQIHKDPRIDVLAKKQSSVNNTSTKNTAKRRYAKGYRLLIVSSNNRNEAINGKTKIYTYFPELKTYMWHQSPFYKVKVGNFTSRNEAVAYQKKLAPLFPAGVFIMNDTVEVKPDDN